MRMRGARARPRRQRQMRPRALLRAPMSVVSEPSRVAAPGLLDAPGRADNIAGYCKF